MQTLLEGPHLVAEALTHNIEVMALFALPDDKQAGTWAATHEFDFNLVDEQALARLAGTTNPRGPVAVIRIPPSRQLSGGDVVVLWGVTDPGNAGTMLRTAAAFGLGLIVISGGVDLWSPKVLRAAAGGHFRTGIEVSTAESPQDLHRRGWYTAAAVVHGGEAPSRVKWPRPCALLIGEEAHGLPAIVADSASIRVTIPMSEGTESLNATAAAAILVWELVNS